jgi:hypothetical protein
MLEAAAAAPEKPQTQPQTQTQTNLTGVMGGGTFARRWVKIRNVPEYNPKPKPKPRK